MMRGRITRVGFGLLALGVVGGCAREVTVRARMGVASLHPYRTYGWMSRDPKAIDNPGRTVLDNQVHLEVDGYLATQGFQMTALETPDFMVGYEWKIGTAAADTLGDFFRYRGAGGTKQLTEAFAIGYEEGIFTLQFIDTGTRRTIWEAQAKALVGRNDQPESLDQVIAAMFKKLEEEQKN